MQGLIFVISCWSLVIFSYYAKDLIQKKQTIAFLFYLIASSTVSLEFHSFQMYFGYINMMIYICYLLSLVRFREQFVRFIKGLIIGMVYCIINILAIYDPASFFINKFITTCGVIVFLSLILSKQLSEQFILIIIGLLQGDLFNYFTYQSINVPYAIGNLEWLDTVLFTSSTLLIIQLVSEYFSKKMIRKRQLV